MKTSQSNTFLAIVAITISGSVTALPSYQIIDLGVIQTYSGNISTQPNTTASAINNNGVVIGSAFHAIDCCNTGNSGFYWSADKGIAQLQQPTARRSYSASAINDAGTIVGTDYGSSDIIMWKDGVITQRINAGNTSAVDINNNNDLLLNNGTFYKNGSITQLGALTAGYQINNNGQVIGDVNGDNAHDYFWNNNTTSVIGNPEWRDSGAGGLNDNGQIVGSFAFSYKTIYECDWSCYEYEVVDSMHAFIFQNNTWLDLGAGYATDINNRGEIIGYTFDGFSPAYFSETGVVSLYDLISNKELFTYISNVSDINDKGQIVGYGQVASNGEYHAFLLNPVPLPASIWLFGASLAGLCGLRARYS